MWNEQRKPLGFVSRLRPESARLTRFSAQWQHGWSKQLSFERRFSKLKQLFAWIVQSIAPKQPTTSFSSPHTKDQLWRVERKQWLRDWKKCFVYIIVVTTYPFSKCYGRDKREWSNFARLEHVRKSLRLGGRSLRDCLQSEKFEDVDLVRWSGWRASWVERAHEQHETQDTPANSRSQHAQQCVEREQGTLTYHGLILRDKGDWYRKFAKRSRFGSSKRNWDSVRDWFSFHRWLHRLFHHWNVHKHNHGVLLAWWSIEHHQKVASTSLCRQLHLESLHSNLFGGSLFALER